jgi:hypothetical protein
MVKERATDILGRVLELDGGNLSPEAARLVLSFGLTHADRDRIVELGEKANEGTLTADEREEYEAYVQVGDVLAIWQPRARLVVF